MKCYDLKSMEPSQNYKDLSDQSKIFSSIRFPLYRDLKALLLYNKEFLYSFNNIYSLTLCNNARNTQLTLGNMCMISPTF